ncbi:MAG: hypothetical protein QNJ32_05990 [Xenococcaceae cyanobacterium MO_167.B27]|nr:hypothetical protein [Xenococcaceae cyanobacterium MO_167.B27]
MAVFWYSLFTFATLALLPWGLYLYTQAPCLELTLLIFIAIAVIYDNAIITMGHLIGKGNILLWLSQPRFFLHVILTPFSVLVALCQSQQAGVSWTSSPTLKLIAWLLTLTLILGDLFRYYKDFNPIPVWFQGTLRYTNAAASNPPIPAMITIFLVGMIGIFIWYQVHWPWLFISSLVMFTGSAIPFRLVGPAMCSGVKVFLMVGFWATEAFVQTI